MRCPDVSVVERRMPCLFTQRLCCCRMRLLVRARHMHAYGAKACADQSDTDTVFQSAFQIICRALVEIVVAHTVKRQRTAESSRDGLGRLKIVHQMQVTAHVWPLVSATLAGRCDLDIPARAVAKKSKPYGRGLVDLARTSDCGATHVATRVAYKLETRRIVTKLERSERRYRHGSS